MESKEVVVLLGPPGAGKGTQATLLSDKFDFYYFETSKILERRFNSAGEKDFINLQGEKYYFSQERKKWEEGALCSPAFVSHLVKKETEKLSQGNESLIFAGSPRTLYEGKEIMPLLVSLYGKNHIKIFLIEISPEESLARNSKRRICELMRHPILYNEETKHLTRCPLDGSKLVKREKLDNPSVIKVRWQEYQKKTLPLIKYFEENNFKLIRIEGKGSVSDVFKRILQGFGND
jgi:adenylate kinase